MTASKNKVRVGINVIVLVEYLLLGVFIGIKAMKFYQESTNHNGIYMLLCMVLAIAICAYLGKGMRNHIICATIICIIAVMCLKLLAWSIVWLVCLIQAIISIIALILQCIFSIIGMLV